MSRKYTNKKSVARLVKICSQAGIKDVVFSPGSRNAPLIIEFVNSGAFRCYCIPDERAAAFYALGLSINSGLPSIISCTSGSAVLNYAPAISEAYYQGVPMLVITADRPAEWIDQGIGQSIRQNNIYSNYIKSSFTFMQEAQSEDDLIVNDQIAHKAIFQSQNAFKGPVHINIPFSEPLYGMTDELPQPSPANPDLETLSSDSEKIGWDSIRQTWKQSARKLVLLGLHRPDDGLQQQLQRLADSGQIVLLTETTSNVYSQNAVQTIDRLIIGFNGKLKDVIPDLLITAGGPIVSKKIKSLFFNHKPPVHWDITPGHSRDTFKALTEHIEIDAAEFFEAVAYDESKNDKSFQHSWIESNKDLFPMHENFMARCPWSDMKAFGEILDKIPQNSVLHMGNSTVVRYVQLFNQRKDLLYFSNRGVSGIDGCSSTALGYAQLSNKLNILITGDISFYYDSNAFWNKHLPTNFKIILINNSGGGIFRIIPGPSSTSQLKEYFEAYQEKSAENIARHHGLNYYKARNSEELESVIESFLSDSNGIDLLEVFTPREKNDKVLSDYFQYLHGKTIEHSN